MATPPPAPTFPAPPLSVTTSSPDDLSALLKQAELSPAEKAYRAAGGAAAAYHGYKRTGSVGWAILWSFLGSAAPLLTNAIALAQGFGKPKGKK